jgi:hypothetical protein
MSTKQASRLTMMYLKMAKLNGEQACYLKEIERLGQMIGWGWITHLDALDRSSYLTEQVLEVGEKIRNLSLCIKDLM